MSADSTYLCDAVAEIVVGTKKFSAADSSRLAFACISYPERTPETFWRLFWSSDCC